MLRYNCAASEDANANRTETHSYSYLESCQRFFGFKFIIGALMNNRQSTYLAVIVLICTYIPCSYAALSADIQKDIYLSALSKHIKASKWNMAKSDIMRLSGLSGIQHANVFYFHKGQVLFKTGDYSSAKQALDVYLQKTGRNGTYYSQAIDLYSDTIDLADGTVKKPLFSSTAVSRPEKPHRQLKAVPPPIVSNHDTCSERCTIPNGNGSSCEDLLQPTLQRARANLSDVRRNEIAPTVSDDVLREDFESAKRNFDNCLHVRSTCLTRCS